MRVLRCCGCVCTIKSLLTCKIHKSALEYSIIRRYTNVVYYYYYYKSFGSTVRPRTFGCVAMGELLCIFRSRLLVYSAGSGVNRVQVVLTGFSRRLFCFVQAKTLCRNGCIYLLAALVLVCVDMMVMSSA